MRCLVGTGSRGLWGMGLSECPLFVACIIAATVGYFMDGPGWPETQV